MEKKDLKIKLADWGLIFTLRKNFELNDDNILETIKYLVDEFVKQRKNKVIIDFRKTERNLTVLGRHNAVNYLKSLTNDLGYYKQAFVIQKPDNTENIKFVENTAYNNAIELVFFYDMESAIEWILS